MAAGSVAMMIAMGIQMAEHVWHKPSVLVFAALTFGAVVVAKLSLIFVVLVMSPFAIFWFWRGRVQ
jgi:hypothetical protein